MKKSKFLKKSLAMLLALMLVVAMIPLSASAAEGDPTVYVDNKPTTLSGSEYSVTASSTTVNVTYVAGKGVTLVAVDKDGTEIGLTGIDLTQKAEKSGEVYTLGLRTKVAQDADDAATTKDYTLKVTVKEVVASSDATIKALTNPSDAENLNNMTNYTISDDTITIWTAFGKAQVSTLDAKNIITTSDKATVTSASTSSVTVAAEDGSTKTYKVVLKTDDGFTSFTVPDQTGDSTITTAAADASTVEIAVPYGTDFTKAIVPTFTVGSNIIAVTTGTTYGEDVVTSGKTEITFTSGVEEFYLWTSKTECGKVTVTLTAPSQNPEAALKTVKVGGSNEVTVSGTTVNVEMPAGTDFADKVTVNVTASENATVSIPAQSKIASGNTISDVNISGKTFVIRVASQDGKASTDYTINLTVAASAEAKLNDFTVKYDDNGTEVSYTAANGTLTLPYAAQYELANYKVYAQFSTGASSTPSITNGTTTLDDSLIVNNKITLKVTASDGTAQTYTITVKYENAKTARTISSATLVGTNNNAEITDDNTYGVTVGTTTDTTGTAVKTLKVNVPYSFSAPTVYFSALKLSDGAKAYVWDTAAKEVKALAADKTGAQADVQGISVPTNALNTEGKVDTGIATKIYVLSEQGSVGKTYSSETELADASTVYYVYGVKATAASGNSLTSIASTLDTNVTASLSGKTVTITVPATYSTKAKTFTLNFKLSKLATLWNGGTELKSDNGSADTTGATSFKVDNGTLKDGANAAITTLTVKAENGNTNTYTVKVVVNKAETGAALTGVKVNNTSASISGKTVNVTLPFGTNKYPVKLTLTASKMATIKVDGEVYNPDDNGGYDLNSDIKITVTSEDEATTNVYTLKASVAAQFSDVSEGDWYYENVMRAVELGILSGRGDGTFGPNVNITRRDFAIMLAQSLGHDNDEPATSPFKDVADSDYGVSSIAYLYEQGITVGDNAGNFNPAANITRQEAAIMLVKAFKATGTSSELYKDDASIASWAKSFVYTAKASGLMKGDTNGSFRPNDTLTRAEAASAMVNAIDN